MDCFLTRARAQQKAAETAANAIADLFANGDLQGVLDRAAQLTAQKVATPARSTMQSGVVTPAPSGAAG